MDCCTERYSSFLLVRIKAEEEKQKVRLKLPDTSVAVLSVPFFCFGQTFLFTNGQFYDKIKMKNYTKIFKATPHN